MKKIVFTILTFLLFINIISAKENKLIISNSDNKLYYNSDMDSSKFMNFTNMVPGENLSEKLIIENNSNYTFKLYLKIQNRNNNELIDYLTMNLFLDDKKIYEGDVIGTNLNLNNDVYYLGTFSPGQISYLDANIKFSDKYNNIFNNDSLIVDWSFYAETDDNIVQIVSAPKTGINISRIILLVSIGLCLIGIIIITVLILNKKKDK